MRTKIIPAAAHASPIVELVAVLPLTSLLSVIALPRTNLGPRRIDSAAGRWAMPMLQ